MGGLQAFVTGINQFDLFSAAVCMSPAFWFVDGDNKSSYDLVKSSSDPNKGGIPCRLYIDAGDCASDNCQVTKLMYRCLLDCGWSEGEDFKFHLETTVPEADMHAEWAWRERSLNALKFAFSK